jgi:hypothetical protein
MNVIAASTSQFLPKQPQHIKVSGPFLLPIFFHFIHRKEGTEDCTYSSGIFGQMIGGQYSPQLGTTRIFQFYAEFSFSSSYMWHDISANPPSSGSKFFQFICFPL